LLHEFYTSPLRHIPGPMYTLFTRLPLKYHILTGSRIQYVHALHGSYGPIVRISPRQVAVSEPNAVATIHRVSGGFPKSPWYEESTLPEGGEPSIFSLSDPKKHAARKKLLGKVFTKTSMRRDWEGTVREKVERAVERIYYEAKNKGSSDVLKWFTMMTTDVVAHLAFGESFRMLELGEKNDYMKMLELISVQNSTWYELPFLYAVRAHISFLKSSNDVVDAQEVLSSYSERALSTLRKHNDNTRTLFTKVMSLAEAEASEKTAGEHEVLTDDEILADIKAIIIGGSDTTSITLTYLVWAVVRRPRLRTRLEAEVASIEPGFDDAELERLPLLNAVIEETLRLYGAAPGQLPRTVPPGGATLGGYFIPGGITVETQAYTLHRDPNVWPDPLRFDETRFLDPSKLSQRQKQLFMPWGAGSRTCLGTELARMELRLGAAVLFRRCKGLVLAAGMSDEMMEMENFFLVSPVGHKCEVTLP
ncbi:putative sterigmatocystin biosynthesis P450 monooxygenase STCB-like protein 3, partial [Colletotrichum chlorophyti]